MERSTPNADPWERSKVTSIYPTTGTSLPYDTIAGGQPVEADPYAGPYTPADAGASSMRSHADETAYLDDPVTTDVDVAGGGFSAIAGAQPAIAEAPTATLDDFAALGIFSDDELAYLESMQLAPEELGSLYDEALVYMQSPGFERWQQSQHDQQVADRTSEQATAPVEPSPQETDAAAPAWNDTWNDRFQEALADEGFDSKTRMFVTSQLRSLDLGEGDLQQAFDYYTGTEQGIAELREVDEQVRAGNAKQAQYLLVTGVMAVGAVAATAALAGSKGNLTRVLTRTAASSADDAARAVASRALDASSAGTLTRGTALADEAAAILRSEASATNRLLHPFRKAATNAAARHLTESARLAPKDILKYGVWMKTGDAVTDAAKAATAVAGSADDAARAASVVAGGADDVARVAASGADDVARIAASGADDVARAAGQAASGAGLLSKAGRALGPIGLVAAAGLGAWSISRTVEAEGGFGEESAKQTGNVAGGLAGGVAGAAAGAAIGSVVPVVGTGIGAVVGGLVGGLGGGFVGEHVGGFLHGLFD